MMPNYRLERPKSVREMAARLIELDYHPVPIEAGSKGPTLPGWDKLHMKVDEVDRYFGDQHKVVGCLHDNLACFDIDVYDPDLADKIVAEAIRRFPGALERIGQEPKSAIVLRLDQSFKVRATHKYERVTEDGEVFSAQVDVRTATRQMVVYGLHQATKRPYRWPRGELWATPRADLPELTEADAQSFRDWCEAELKAWAGVKDRPAATIIDIGFLSRGIESDRPSEKQFLAALEYADPSAGHEDGWRECLMGIHDFYNGSPRGLEVAKDWSSRDSRYTPQEVERKWKSFEAGKGIGYRSVFHHAKRGGADLSAIARMDRKEPPALPNFTDVAKADGETGPPASDEDGEDWHAGLIVNSRGRVLFNTANVLTIMEHSHDWRGVLAYDEFRQVKMLTLPIPGGKVKKAGFQGREITDADFVQAVSWFNRNGFPDATKTVVIDVMDVVARDAIYHPVRNYLDELPEWDGTPRLDSWLFDYCDAVAEDDDTALYISEVGKRWLISCVARIMRPGCKADHVLILEGAQGARKSTTLKTICGEEWFGDSLPPMHSKDASDYLRGKWVIELSELASMTKAEVEVVKAFISRTEERFRPAYARTEITYPRQCVFAGSTNKADYLRDETGNRRFWPVRVGAICDTTALKRDRDQIWAEAVKAYRDGEQWWLAEEIEAISRVQQDARSAEDAWQGDIESYCENRSEVSQAEIAKNALGFETQRIDRQVSNRISAILAAIGFVKDGRFSGGENKGRARFRR